MLKQFATHSDFEYYQNKIIPFLSKDGEMLPLFKVNDKLIKEGMVLKIIFDNGERKFFPVIKDAYDKLCIEIDYHGNTFNISLENLFDVDVSIVK